MSLQASDVEVIHVLDSDKKQDNEQELVRRYTLENLGEYSIDEHRQVALSQVALHMHKMSLRQHDLLRSCVWRWCEHTAEAQEDRGFVLFEGRHMSR